MSGPPRRGGRWPGLETESFFHRVRVARNDTADAMAEIDLEAFWKELKRLAEEMSEREPALVPLLSETIVDRRSFAEALTYRLARKLGNHATSLTVLHEVFSEAFEKEPAVLGYIARDMIAVNERDPACRDLLTPLLFFKGFQSITAYRVGHHLWNDGRHELALYFQSLVSETFGVDIHPAARIGCGILLDHATSFVAGETTVVDDNVSILHEVTLGGTGKERGDRHPKVRSGVLIGAGAKILGRVEIGEGAKVGAGSVVVRDVPPHTSVAGVPARIVGHTADEAPALGMDQRFDA